MYSSSVIEEFSARWRALKRYFSGWRRQRISIEEFSARWRALKRTVRKSPCRHVQVLRNFRLAEEHWNSLHLRPRRLAHYNWGIFGSLKSTETFLLLGALTHPSHWGIFGSLKSTETSRAHGAVCFGCLYWGIFGSLKSTETVFPEPKESYMLKLRNFRLAEEHWN